MHGHGSVGGRTGHGVGGRTSGLGLGSKSGRRCMAAVCCWVPLWRRGLVLLLVAAGLSLVLPDAPLARLLLAEDAERQRLVEENEQRLEHSLQILQTYRDSLAMSRHSHLWNPPAREALAQPGQAERQDGPDAAGDGGVPTADVGVTVLTMARGRRMGKKGVSYRTQYLTQSVARLLQLMNDTSLRRSYTMRICNIDDHPDLFSEPRLLEDVVPVFRRYGRSLNSSQPPVVIWEKLKVDYVYCLQQTLAQGVRYALLVEDDAVAHEQLFQVLEHVLDTVVETPTAGRLAYVKLYHPQRLLGYLSLEVERLTELLCLSLTLGAVLTALCYCRSAHGCRSGVHDVRTPRGQAWLMWAGWAVVVGVLALAVGRTNLLEWRRLSPHLYQVTPTPSCCIPAVLYTRAGATDLARFLLSVNCTAQRSTDIRMDEFRHVHDARGLLVQPNLFSHIGLVSSLRTREVSPLIVS